jgi:cell division protein FtsX
MRELIHALTASSRQLRHINKRLKERIQTNTAAIKGLIENGDRDNENFMLAQEALRERLKTEADEVARQLMRLRMSADAGQYQATIQQLADRRQLMRRLLWRPTLVSTDLSPEESTILQEIHPRALADQRAILADAEHQLRLLNSASGFRRKARAFDLVAAVSLHLSSHGDGVGAFNYGWLYPFRPKINRTANYHELDRIMKQAAVRAQPLVGTADLFKDTLRPSRQRSWQSYFLDQPPLGGEVSALAGFHGFSLVTTNDARAVWGTPYDTKEKVNLNFAADQAIMICHLVDQIGRATTLKRDKPPRMGFSTLDGRAKFLRQGELFADQPAPGTVLLVYQGPAYFHAMVDQMGTFTVHGLADAKHSFHKAVLEGYKINPHTGRIMWTIDKKQTGKDAYRVKMRRQSMETDLILFASNGITLFNLLEPRTLRFLTKPNVIDGRREATPVKYFYSRLDTWTSTISTFFLEPGAPLKLTLSDSVLDKKFILLNNNAENTLGNGYVVDQWPMLYPTEFHVARDMWTLLDARIKNIESHGIFNERIHNLQMDGIKAIESAEAAMQAKEYDRMLAESTKAWALANRVYEDVESTQKDVLYGVLFYIALFVPFAFCAERLLFSYTNIYKRIIAFIVILVVLITVIYNVHPAFQLAYSPMVVILAFLIMGLSLLVTLIIFFRFEDEINRFHNRAASAQTENLGRWKAFAAAFLLGVSNLRRRRVRTALTCTTLVILTFTIMSFTSAKSLRLQARIQYDQHASYQGILMKNVNWRDLPPEAHVSLTNTFPETTTAAPRVWLEDDDRTRTPRIPIRLENRAFEAQGLMGLSHREPHISGIDKVLISGRWFNPTDRHAILLPERLARNLGIDITRPGAHGVNLWGMPFKVIGIFSAEGLQALTDLDGEPLTPAIFPREISAEMTEEIVSALESGDDVRGFQSRYQHIETDLTVIIPFQTLLAMGGHLKAVALRPHNPDDQQTMAQKLVDRYGFSLFSGEPNGTFLYHASDSMSYSGVPNIIIPIVISILIVLNTMICSVYERKREIGIYTSVGLAPSHVSFLFVAEAMAFAVLSTVFGYLLAQTAATFLAHTPLWAGITVNYSSMASVGAMVLVILVVLISVIYPSKVAGEIAIPDINRSWTLPPAEGTQLTVTLPFLMTYAEHRSIGGFLYDYFEGHRDITHGRFSTADIAFEFVCAVPPEPTQDDNKRDWLPEEFNECLRLTSSVWLAPFDFGIMQHVDLQFQPSSEQAGFLEIEIRLIRESGEANAWHRINKAFLHDLRRQLLTWRSLDQASKTRFEQTLNHAEIQAGINPNKLVATP